MDLPLPGPVELPEGVEFCEHVVYFETTPLGDRFTRCRRCPAWGAFSRMNPNPGFPSLGPWLQVKRTDG